MGVTFCGNFASGTLLVPFHWRGMCYAHQFSRAGSLCVREAEETAPDPVGLHKLNFNHTVAPVIGTMTPRGGIWLDLPTSYFCVSSCLTSAARCAAWGLRGRRTGP